MELKILIQRGEDGGFVASVPALKGCWSQGATRAAARENIREAIKAWLEAEQDKDDRGGKAGRSRFRAHRRGVRVLPIVFPAGLSCTWKVLESVKKHYRFG